jgi:hypothetical protein
VIRSLGSMLIDHFLHNAPGDGLKSWGGARSGSTFDQVARSHRKALGELAKLRAGLPKPKLTHAPAAPEAR